jgi:hypothetical protein
MSTTFLFLDQQLGNDHQVVGQHGRAHQQLEPLAPLRRQRFMPRPRKRTDMRPSMPARKRWPFLNTGLFS